VEQQDLTDALGRWCEAGLLEPETADRISAFELARSRPGDAPRVPSRAPSRSHAPTAPPPPDGPRAVEASRRVRVAEAVGYVGAALALGAVALFVVEVWWDLTPSGRATLSALVAVVSGAGAVSQRTSDVPALQRLGSVLSATAVAAAAWTTAVITADVLEWSGRDVRAAVSLTALATASAAYRLRPRSLAQIVLLLSLIAAVLTGLFRSPLPTDAFWSALSAAAVAGAWALLGIGGWLRPRNTAITAGASVAMLALQVGSFGSMRPNALMLGVLVATGVVAGAVATGWTTHLAVGAIGLFVLLPQLVFDLFGGAIGVPATLLVVGLLLVLLAVGLSRVRRELEPPRPSTGGAS
jgi:hypothetical protein